MPASSPFKSLPPMIRSRYRLLPGIAFLLLLSVVALTSVAVNPAAQAADSVAHFVLQEHLGHAWSHECVSFPLTPAQATQAGQGTPLVDNDGQPVAYQLQPAIGEQSPRLWLQTDLPPLATRAFHFDRQAKAAESADLKIQESPTELRIENGLTGVVLRKTLTAGEGPIARFRLRSGQWTGGSSLIGGAAVTQYTVEVTARGPVFIEVQCRVQFADEGKWSLRFRLESQEPVLLVEEHFDAPGGGDFRVSLGDADYGPTDLLYRAGGVDDTGKVKTYTLTDGRAFLLEPWLHWWNEDRRGSWCALYTAAPPAEISIDQPTDNKEKSSADELLGGLAKKPRVDPHPNMLMIGLLRPSLWKDPQWSGKAAHVSLPVSMQIQDGVARVAFPLGGGRRQWLLGAPEKATSLAVLAEKNRKAAPEPQRLLIKHGDFPLDEVKDYVLTWEGDHQQYPRLLIGKDDLPALRQSLVSDPRERRRWEREQPIDKYNIGDPLKEYYASGSAILGDRIVSRTDEWLQSVVLDDLLEQHGRVTLGVAPHNQAVLLLPTLNLADSALGVESLTPELRKRFLAQLAFLGYVVNRADYWSPERGFSANPNMTTTVAQYKVTIASLLPSHPLAREWADQGLGTLRYQLDAWSDEDGGWLEAPHYAMVSYDHMLGAFLMAARAGFGNHLYEDRMRKVAEWFASISTPPDAHTGGFRHLPPIGNTYHGESTGMFGIVAGVWKKRDPQFAARMEWMCQQHGSPDLGLGWSFPSMTGYKDLLKAHGVKPQQPDYGSAWFRKTGVVLRNQLGSGRETYLHLIAGSHHEHYDYDSGSIVIWGKGRVLADDWGYIGRHSQKYHNLLSSPASGGNMQVTDFSTQPAFDYVSGRKGAWQRQIGFVKDRDPLGPSFFLLRDTHAAAEPAVWRMWLTAQPAVSDKPDAPDFPEPGVPAGKPPAVEGLGDIFSELSEAKKKKTVAPPRPVQIHDQGVTVTGADDVDFDLFFYQPEQLNLTTQTEYQDMTVGNRDGKVGPLRLTQTALVATLKSPGAVVCLVYPRLKGEAPPQVLWHAEGRIAEVKTRFGTDYAVLAPPAENTAELSAGALQTADKKLAFQGVAGAAQLRGDKLTLTLGAAGQIQLGQQTLSDKAAAAEAFDR
ncbi:heparinase II/III family protein [Lignipirellula cremea]|uniref:Heparin-sulfate lyase N-terminal domain-containing protein n=1 Tax=Lignipirellula cremea TaxID=2528010 RepID=A0A518DLZ9_9BACT|nr:heparinase II/III family protein [Lignipirellula cremea]QDU92869.1 hypothetical protein Pla8534_06420 [Lignipirellula cremea]